MPFPWLGCEMKPGVKELASRISRALISASISSPTKPNSPCSWTPALEQKLHSIGCRSLLTPELVAGVIDPFLLKHHSLAFGFFNWASQQPGFSHTSLSYESILKSLCLSHQYNALDSLLKQVKSQNIRVQSSVYRSIISLQIIGKKAQNAFVTFNQANPLIHEIGAETCNSILAALASDGYFNCAQKVFKEMILQSLPFNTIGFGVFIWRLCKSGDFEKVLIILDDVKGGDSEINGSLVALLIAHGLCYSSRVSEASSLMEELRIRGWKPDFIAYRTVAEGYKSMGDVVSKEKVLKRKRKLGVAPRAIDYSKFIYALVSLKLISEAKELGEMIVSGNFPIEDDVLNVLIETVSITDPGSAKEFFNFMVGKERFPTLTTLCSLSRNLCKHGKIDGLVEVFQVLNSQSYFKDLEGYNMMLKFLCKAGGVKEAYEVVQEMKKKGVEPDVMSYNLLMEACCKEDLMRPARKLWDEMFACGFGGNLKTYNILIQKFSEGGQIGEAQRLFHHMLDKGITPDAITYTFLLEGLCQETKLEEAFEVYQKSVKQDVDLARAILSTFILSLSRKGHLKAASRFLCDLGFDIGNTKSHVILLKCLADSRELSLTFEHLKWIREISPSRLQDISTELLASLSTSSNQEAIGQVLQAIKDDNLLKNVG